MHGRKIIINVLHFFGIGDILFLFNRINKRVPILLFHRVSPQYDPFTEPYNPVDFEKIIVYLKKYYSFRSLKDLWELKRNSLTDNSAFLVFDDGFKDFYEFAFPILKRHQVPVTIFVCPKYIGSPSTLWNNELFSYFLTSTSSKITLNLNNKRREIFLSKNAKENYQTVMFVHKYLLSLNSHERSLVMKELKKQLDPESVNLFPLMNWNDLKKLSSDPLIDIQSHTNSHLFLPSISSKEELEEELFLSKKLLSKYLKRNICSVAYPVGGYTKNILQFSKSYYKHGFAVDEELVNLKDVENHKYSMKIPRFNITDKTSKEVFFRINGFHKIINRIKIF